MHTMISHPERTHVLSFLAFSCLSDSKEIFKSDLIRRSEIISPEKITQFPLRKERRRLVTRNLRHQWLLIFLLNQFSWFLDWGGNTFSKTEFVEYLPKYNWRFPPVVSNTPLRQLSKWYVSNTCILIYFQHVGWPRYWYQNQDTGENVNIIGVEKIRYFTALSFFAPIWNIWNPFIELPRVL